MREEYPIDFVITWVDGNDPKWRNERAQYEEIKNMVDNKEKRYRDTGTLKYLFRGIEKFAPWVNKIYFVTCDQKPEWLNVYHPKLICVSHKDYIPSKYLPTYSSHTIEWNFHRIQGLSEHFVYFNDDCFLIAPVKKNDFFIKGLPCDSAVLHAYAMAEYPFFFTASANAGVINRNFEKKKVMKENFWKFYTPLYKKYLLENIFFKAGERFVGFRNFHMPSSLLKSVYLKIWEKEPEIIEQACIHRFRTQTDVNQWLIMNWQICEGKFVPRDVDIGYFALLDKKEKLQEMYRNLKRGHYKMLCANDEGIEDINWLSCELIKYFESILPEKSMFET